MAEFFGGLKMEQNLRPGLKILRLECHLNSIAKIAPSHHNEGWVIVKDGNLIVTSSGLARIFSEVRGHDLFFKETLKKIF